MTRTLSPIGRELVARSIALQHAVLATFAVGAVSFIVGVNLPVSVPAPRYDLVQFEGDDSDIIDTGLSLDDCMTVIPVLQAMHHVVTCRTAAL